MKVQQYRVQLIPDRVLTIGDSHVEGPSQAREVFFALLADLPHEELHAVFVNRTNEVIGTAMLAMGGQHGCATTPKDLFRAAVACNAAALILGHNHPSGDPTPSPEDIEFTKSALQAGEVLGIPVLDHLVVVPARRLCRSVMTEL